MCQALVARPSPNLLLQGTYSLLSVCLSAWSTGQSVSQSVSRRRFIGDFSIVFLYAWSYSIGDRFLHYRNFSACIERKRSVSQGGLDEFGNLRLANKFSLMYTYMNKHSRTAIHTNTTTRRTVPSSSPHPTVNYTLELFVGVVSV